MQALTIDTTLIGNNSPGPYILGWHFVDTSTLIVKFTDTAAGTIPPYTYIDKLNGILFSEQINSGTAISVHYQTEFFGLRKTYSLYERNFIDLGDSTRKKETYIPRDLSPFTDENLTVSGYKSMGISFGNQGQMNLEQALEVRIFGRIGQNTELSANLSDQGTSLEGDTREIGEIDRMYIALENPKYNVVVGDQYVTMLQYGLIEGHKKIKGISAAYTGKTLQTKVSGAVSGGKYTVQTIRGQLGFQGPYYLTGNNEADIIIPIRGTVKVLVDGKQLKEGESEDYVVDYEIGTIRFMPTFTINDDNVIQVYYEYKAFDYQRAFLGSDIGVSNTDSSLSVNGVIWYETDVKNHPIDIDHDKVIIDSLKQAGDNPPLVPTGREVHPNDVSSQNSKYRLYKIDTAQSDFHYVYTPYNSEKPENNNDFYIVWFNRVADRTGEYIIDTTEEETDPRGPVYKYVGMGNGNFSVYSPASTPRRATKGEITASFNPKDFLLLSSTVAGEEEDKNLFSKKDDNDNTASASKTFLRFGNNVYDEKCYWLNGIHLFSSRRFSREIISSFERKRDWDREYSLVLGNEINIWNIIGGSTIWPGISIDTKYGQYFQNDSLFTQSIGAGTRVAPKEHTTFNYSGQFIYHFYPSENDNSLRNKASLYFDYDLVNYGIGIEDEWKKDSLDRGTGFIGGKGEVLFKPASLKESIYYSKDLKGNDAIYHASDTGSTFLWEQGISYSPVDGWRVSGSSSYNKRIKGKKKKSVLLISASNDIASVRRGFSTHQDYRLSSEKSSAYIQVPIYVGKGNGSYSYDSSVNEYTLNRRGDYIIEEHEVFDTTSNQRVRKNQLRGNWFFKPQGKNIIGILADISWNGLFVIDEHIMDKGLHTLRSWIPGYTSLSKENDDHVSFADIFYRQDLNWRPEFDKELQLNLYIRPFLKKIRDRDENGLEWGGESDKKWSKLSIGLESRMFNLSRVETYGITNHTDIKDFFITLKQRYYFIPSFSMFAKETAGKAKRDMTDGPYYRLQPGLTFQPKGKGWAELSYTWSDVDKKLQIEYPMAQGFGAGTSHVIDLITDINAGDHFSIGGSYRGEYNKQLSKEWLHNVSLEVKAYL